MSADKTFSIIGLTCLCLLMVFTSILHYISKDKEEKNRYEIISNIYLAAMLILMVLNK